MKKTIIAFVIGVLVMFSATVAALTTTFTDVKSSDWYYNDVMNMASWGVIQGYPDGTFGPGNTVNRAELSAMWNRYNEYLKTQFASIDTVGTFTTVPTLSSDSTTINLNTKGTLNGIGLTLKSIQDYTAYDPSQEAPAAGNKYVSIDVLIENNSGNGLYIYPLNFTLKDSNSYEYSETFNILVDTQLNMGTLRDGASVRGIIVYEVPTTVSLTELKYDIDFGNLGNFYVKLK